LENSLKKKSSLHPGETWLEALHHFENELHEHVEGAKKDQLRFQTGRLFRSLIKRIKRESTGKDEWVLMFACYQFVTDPSRHLGYNEARRLHGEEIEARGLPSARSFCSPPFPRLDEHIDEYLENLRLRVRSIAWWMEAQESFALWLVFKELRPAWRGNMDKRAQVIQACYLSKLPQLRRELLQQPRDSKLFGAYLRIGANYQGKPWDARQWQNILEQAARFTEKRYDCTPLEEWLWSCYPVFKLCGWNTREVQKAATQRGFWTTSSRSGSADPHC
jgi:hypothetical protein